MKQPNEKQNAPKTTGLLPVRSAFIWSLASAGVLLTLFFLWYGLFANLCADSLLAGPEWIANILLSSRWHPVASWIVGILLAAIVVVLFYVLIMLCYLAFKRRHATAKFRCEVLAIATALFLSWLFKAYVLSLDPLGQFQPDFLSAVRAIFGSLYAALGGFSFEGLPGDADNVASVFIVCAYYGSSVVAGLVFVSVIGSYAAYEFYSFLLLRVLRTKGKDIYIFTALNSETLNLANSIVDDPDREKARNALIIFSGSSLQPFDRHDALCTEVMSRGYIYWSVSGNDESTIMRKLWPHASASKADYYGSITVFAFDSDDDHIPNEEENMDYVLLDISHRLDAMEKKTKSYTSPSREYLALEKDINAIEKEIKELKALAGPDQSAWPEFLATKIAEQDKLLVDKKNLQDAYAATIKKVRLQALNEKGITAEYEENDDDKTFALRRRLHRAEDERRGFDMGHIAYYILTKRRIDYQAYQDKIAALEKRFKDLYIAGDDECLLLHHEEARALAEKESVQAAKKKAQKELLVAKPGSAEYKQAEKDLKQADEKLAAIALASTRFSRCWQLAKPFSIHVWNEADCIASEAQSAIYSKHLPHSDVPFTPNKDLTWVVSLGFGTNGQSIAKALYSFSSNLADDETAANFLCDVYDPRGLSHISGLFQMEMPYSCCISAAPANPGRDPMETYRARLKETTDDVLSTYQGDDRDALEKDIAKEMPLPVFCFHDGGFGRAGFSDLFRFGPVIWKEGKDQYGAENDGDRSFYCPDYIVVATGDDYESIRVVNAVAALLAERKPKRLITLFVNVWDDKNNNLVEGYNRGAVQKEGKRSQDFQYADNIRIVIVGNNDDIYRCDRIVENVDAINYNRVYDLVADGAGENEVSAFNDQASRYFKNPDKVKQIIVPREASAIARNRVELWPSISQQQREYAMAAWRGNALWRRVSSAASHRFGPAFYQMMKVWDSKENFGVFFAKLSRVEHQRWMRFHFADGWKYCAERNDGLRRHKCLLPVAYIPSYTLAYDLFNVFLGISLCMEKGDREAGFEAAIDWTKIHNLTEQVTAHVSDTYPRCYDNGQMDIAATCFGFGREGEAIAEAIFVNTYDKVRDKSDLRPNKFHARVYGDEDYGPYRVRHRFAIVTDKIRDIEESKATAETAANYRRLLTSLSKRLAKNGGSKTVKNEMSFPANFFYSADPANFATIAEFVDGATDSRTLPDYIVVSMPSDEQTLELFRRLLFLLRKSFVGEAKLTRRATIYACFHSAEVRAKAESLIGEGLIENLSVKLLTCVSTPSANQEKGKALYGFLSGGLDAKSVSLIDAFAPSAQAFASTGRFAFGEKDEAAAAELLSCAKSSKPLSEKELNAQWDGLAEDEKRFYINAALFAKALQSEAGILRDSHVGEAEVLARLSIIAHHRNVRYLICDSWIYREDEGEDKALNHYSKMLVPFRALSVEDCRRGVLMALFALAA